uniref:Uncharacterized protein n=1 Tax=Rhizophora mucronata TaxID=61149 RepID=A0A2P2IK29_RHIMU
MKYNVFESLILQRDMIAL